MQIEYFCCPKIIFFCLVLDNYLYFEVFRQILFSFILVLVAIENLERENINYLPVHCLFWQAEVQIGEVKARPKAAFTGSMIDNLAFPWINHTSIQHDHILAKICYKAPKTVHEQLVCSF